MNPELQFDDLFYIPRFSEDVTIAAYRRGTLRLAEAGSIVDPPELTLASLAAEVAELRRRLDLYEGDGR